MSEVQRNKNMLGTKFTVLYFPLNTVDLNNVKSFSVNQWSETGILFWGGGEKGKPKLRQQQEDMWVCVPALMSIL